MLAVVAVSGVGLLGTNTLPLLVGALMDGLSLDASSAGWIGSAELGAVAITSLLVAPAVARVSRRRLAVIGALGVVVGYAGSAGLTGIESLVATRVVSGLGAGVALAVGNAVVAGSVDPDALYARATVLGGLFAAILMSLLPLALGWGGYRAGFLVLGCASLVCIPFVARVPARPGVGVGVQVGAAPHRGLALLVLVGLLADAVAGNAIWTFSERIGVRSGLEPTAVGIVLGGSVLVGLFGAGLAAWLGTRRGRAVPLAAALLVASLAKWGLTQVTLPAAFVALQLVWGFAYLFSLPFALGTLAALDRLGRWSAAAVGVITIGSAIGPAGAGVLVERGGYPALGGFVIAAGGITLALVVWVAARVDRQEAEAQSAAAR